VEEKMDDLNLFFDNQNKIVEFFKAGEYIFRNGTPSYGAFCVCSGKIALIYKSDDGFFNCIIKEAGDLFGDDNINVHNYIFDALAIEDSEVFFYDKNLFLEILFEVGQL
jgi:CRP-like cAMP-binding protein